jgi:hypothetical protein
VPRSAPIAAALPLASGVVLVLAGQVTARVADLLVVGSPTGGAATAHGRLTIHGDGGG